MNLYLDENCEQIISTLQNAGFLAYAVGGCVRDGLMKRQTTDYDITTSAKPEEIKSALAGYKTFDTGIRHGTVTVIVDKSPYEITTFRSEASYSDSRHPDSVSFITDLETDLSRRDFTMNAIAYNKIEGIIDPFGGTKDIQNRIIRTVGNPYKRFEEDALRILRALRFSATLGFEIEAETAKAVNDLLPTVKMVSPERIYVEIKKILCGDYAAEVISKFSPALSSLLPIDTDFAPLQSLPKDFPMRLTKLCGDKALDVLKGLRADNFTKNRCALLLNSSPIPDGETEIKLYISTLGRENAHYLRNYRSVAFGEDKTGRMAHIMSTCSCLSVSELKINGDDIIAVGIKGKAVAEVQKRLLCGVIKGEFPNEREVLLERLKSLDISDL